MQPMSHMQPAAVTSIGSVAHTEYGHIGSERGRYLRSYSRESLPPPPVSAIAAMPASAANLAAVSRIQSAPTSATANNANPLPNSAGLDGPWALLDLDLTIVRADQSFRSLVSADANIDHRPLEHFLGPESIEVMRRLRNDLRRERDTREPALLPPITSASEQDMLKSISEKEIMSSSSSYTDGTDIWTFRLSNGVLEKFPFGVRLGKKSGMYYVILIIRLPSHTERYRMSLQEPSSHLPRNPLPPSPYGLQSPFAMGSTQSPYPPSSHNAPLQAFQPVGTTLPPLQASAGSFTTSPVAQRDFPPSHSVTPTRAISTLNDPSPRATVMSHDRAARPAPATPMAPPPAWAQQQLPPISGMLPRPSSQETSEAGSAHQRSRSSGSSLQEAAPVEDPERGPKRRRFDISDVLE
jgi:hypothetical protein